MKRILRMLVDSSSLPPTRLNGENLPCAGSASTNTPAPVKVSEAVLASPVAYQSRPEPSSWRSPVDCAGRASEICVQSPPPVEDRQTPPLAAPAYTCPALSAAMPVMRPVTLPAPPEELES